MYAGITSENVAARFGVTREEQDALAVRSHARAAAAQASGRFNDEIVPVHTIWKDPQSGEEKEIVVDKDDGIRAGVTVANLAKLKPAFQRGGTTTAGNSSQVGAYGSFHVHSSNKCKFISAILGFNTDISSFPGG